LRRLELGFHNLSDQGLAAPATRGSAASHRNGPNAGFTGAHAASDLAVGNSPTVTHYHALCSLGLTGLSDTA
jgi:hypothetical protein